MSRGSLLIAYTMGLGKTPIAIAAAEQLLQEEKIKTCLVVCSASLKYQWAEKLAQFTDLPSGEKKVGKEVITVPSSGCFIIDGNRSNRRGLYDLAAGIDNRPRYIIIGYDNVLIDSTDVKALKPDMVILDEATAIKSFKAQRSKKIKKLLQVPYRLALTGTPVENRPDELFSIMQWVDADCLGRYDLFEKAYITRNNMGWVESYKNLHVLKKRLEPAVSRLTDEDMLVKDFMPNADEQEWYVGMPEEMQDLYKKIAIDMLTELDVLAPYSDFNVTDYYTGMDESKPSGKLMAMYTCLEMLVDHPDLIIWSAKQYEQDKKGGSKYANNLWLSGAVDSVRSSPKFDFLNFRIPELLEKHDKILIFSKYKYMLNILEDDLGIPCVQFHGSMSPIQKAESVARFKNDPECRLFLSSHAGAYGMDMYMSNLLINYDLPWSAGKRDQINYRHRRRSSTYDTVYVRNLVVSGSFEERRLRILDRKRNLGSAILDGKGDAKIKLSGDSLRDHLTTAAAL